MNKNILHTTTFFFPDYPTFPRIKLPLSSLKQGRDGVFALAVSPIFEAEAQDQYVLPCVFIEIDLATGEVTERAITFPHRNFNSLQIEYDTLNQLWVVALDALTRKDLQSPHQRILDLYEISHETPVWHRILHLEEAQSEIHYLVMLWQNKASFPLIFATFINDGGLSDERLFWQQWRNADLTISDTTRLLGTCFLEAPYRFEKTFLLFTGEYESSQSLWRLRISAYDHDGIRLHSQFLPNVSFPNRYAGYYIADDLWDWLWPTIRLTQGPTSGDQGGPTCVAALLLKEQLERSRSWHRGRLPDSNHNLPLVQGGLYWIDDSGHILHHESSLLGDKISLCLCGTLIMGTDQLENQRRLWSWSPIDKTELTVRALLSSDAERVILVAMENTAQKTNPLFWCVEEYTQGIRVSLWMTEPFQEVQSNWLAEVWLADRWSEPADYREPCTTVYQDTLLMVVITQERRFQVLQFSPEMMPQGNVSEICP